MLRGLGPIFLTFMENRLERSMRRLVVSAGKAADAAETNKAQIKLAHCTGEVMGALTKAADESLKAFREARALLKQRRAELIALRDEAREFTMLSCDVLKPIYGRVHSVRWGGTGFERSLASPMKPELLKLLLDCLENFFEQRPELQIVDRQITAVAAKALATRLQAAIHAVVWQKTKTGLCKDDRDKKFAALRKGMRSLVDELNILLEPLDPRWRLFGFNLPGAVQTPEVPEKPVVSITPDHRAQIAWPRSARANHYRVWVKVVGVEEEPQAVGSPTDTDFMWEELPAEGTLEISVSAVNPTGESARSEVVVWKVGG